MFEPIHGSYPQATGKVLPICSFNFICSYAFNHFNLNTEANLIREAVDASLNKNVATPDLNKDGNITTTQVGNYIAEFIGIKTLNL